MKYSYVTRSPQEFEFISQTDSLKTVLCYMKELVIHQCKQAHYHKLTLDRRKTVHVSMC